VPLVPNEVSSVGAAVLISDRPRRTANANARAARSQGRLCFDMKIYFNNARDMNITPLRRFGLKAVQTSPKLDTIWTMVPD